MTRRNKIIIVAVVTFLIIGIILFLLWWFRSKEKEISPGPDVDVIQGIEVPANLPTASASLPSETGETAVQQNLRVDIKAIASTFTERFGSYSNQDNFSNLNSLRDLMTIKMRTWADQYIAQQIEESGDNSVYYGFTTKAVSVKIDDLDITLGRAEVLVSTQRQEARGDINNPRVFYQDLKLSMTKNTEGWKVDEANWQ